MDYDGELNGKEFSDTFKEGQDFEFVKYKLSQVLEVNPEQIVKLSDYNKIASAYGIDKYELNATYFIITGRYDSYKLKTKYVDFESHSDNLHNNYKCPGGQQGGQLLCEKESKIKADLKLSQEKLGGSHYFSYPFFDFNDRAKRILKQQGFKLAFIGQWNTDGYSTYNTDRYMIRRKTIFSTDSLNVFKNYLK